MRQAFLTTYEADEGLKAYAMEFVDKMSEWIEARVQALEAEASGKAGADEGGAEPKS